MRRANSRLIANTASTMPASRRACRSPTRASIVIFLVVATRRRRPVARKRVLAGFVLRFWSVFCLNTLARSWCADTSTCDYFVNACQIKHAFSTVVTVLIVLVRLRARGVVFLKCKKPTRALSLSRSFAGSLMRIGLVSLLCWMHGDDLSSVHARRRRRPRPKSRRDGRRLAAGDATATAVDASAAVLSAVAVGEAAAVEPKIKKKKTKSDYLFNMTIAVHRSIEALSAEHAHQFSATRQRRLPHLLQFGRVEVVAAVTVVVVVVVAIVVVVVEAANDARTTQQWIVCQHGHQVTANILFCKHKQMNITRI